MNGVYQCPSCPRTLDFFTNGSVSNFDAWTEIVYQAIDERVGFQLDEHGQAFLSEILRDSWAFHRDRQLFYEVDSGSLNFHNLHNEAAIVAIRPKKRLLAEFDALANFQASQKQNALRSRLGRKLLAVDEPQLCACTDVESRRIAGQCLETITRDCDASLLLRASEYGLTGALFSHSTQKLSSLIAEASASTGLKVLTVERHEELPCW